MSEGEGGRGVRPPLERGTSGVVLMVPVVAPTTIQVFGPRVTPVSESKRGAKSPGD